MKERLPTTTTHSRIPTFASIEEEAEFWDTHDTTDFEDEFEPVEIKFARPLRHSLVVPFEGEELDRLYAAAKDRGIGPAALARIWVLDALERAMTVDTDETKRRSSAD